MLIPVTFCRLQRPCRRRWRLRLARSWRESSRSRCISHITYPLTAKPGVTER